MSDSNAEHGRSDEVDWTVVVQQLLDVVPGNHVLLLPVWDASGEVQDFWIAAASAGTEDAFGRTGDSVIGVRLREDYGEAVTGDVWQAFRDAFADGEPRTVGPFPFARTTTDLPPARFTLSLRRLGAGLLDSWTRDDDMGRPDERIARTERLANLGWSEHDLGSGTTVWSDQLYRIFERDPAAGPLSDAEMAAVTVPEDRAIRQRANERLALGRPVDVTFRISVGSGIKHLRAVAEMVADVHGRPLRIMGIVQDVTARVISGTRLATVQRQLSEHQQSLASENRLVAELQQIILPIPLAPVDLPGLRVAVRYLPAEQANRIGGDWFFAGSAPDGSVVIAVGDVAGHGIRAAATMAKLRHAFATLVATATADPAELLRHLNRLMHANGEPTDIASAIVARHDPVSSTLVFAQAGHPAPLRTRGGATVELTRPPGIMLGVVPEPFYGTESVVLRPGDLLVFYTDGLVEHRDRSLEQGLKPVIETLDRLSAQGSPQPLADLLAQLDRANPSDDTCILAIRPLPVGEAGQPAVSPTHTGAADLSQASAASPGPRRPVPIAGQRS